MRILISQFIVMQHMSVNMMNTVFRIGSWYKWLRNVHSRAFCISDVEYLEEITLKNQLHCQAVSISLRSGHLIGCNLYMLTRANQITLCSIYKAVTTKHNPLNLRNTEMKSCIKNCCSVQWTWKLLQLYVASRDKLKHRAGAKLGITSRNNRKQSSL